MHLTLFVCAICCVGQRLCGRSWAACQRVATMYSGALTGAAASYLDLPASWAKSQWACEYPALT
jgi:hypothetical protein